MSHTNYSKQQTIRVRQGNQQGLKIGKGRNFDSEEDIKETKTEYAEDNSLIAQVLAEGGNESTFRRTMT
jgi:hypothetical protein